MKEMNDTQNDWQKIGIDDGMLAEVRELDRRCFRDKGFQRLAERPHDFGDIHVLQDNGTLIGYALWLPEFPDAYISRIGTASKDGGAKSSMQSFRI